MVQPLYGNPVDVATKVTAFLPKALNMPNGDGIAISWYDAEEVMGYSGTYPYGTFAMTVDAPTDRTSRYYDVAQYGDTQVNDSFTYAASTASYLLTQPDVHTLVSVTGLVSGIAHTFVNNTDFILSSPSLSTFQSVSYDPPIEYTTLGQLQWKSGGVKPDASTTFIVHYLPRRGQERRVVYSYPTIRLTIHCKDLAAASNGATVAYSRNQLSQFALDWLSTYLRISQGKGIGDARRDITIRTVLAAGFAPYDPADSVRRSYIDLQLCRRILPPTEDFVFIGATQEDTTPHL